MKDSYKVRNGQRQASTFESNIGQETKSYQALNIDSKPKPVDFDLVDIQRAFPEDYDPTTPKKKPFATRVTPEYIAEYKRYLNSTKLSQTQAKNMSVKDKENLKSDEIDTYFVDSFSQILLGKLEKRDIDKKTKMRQQQ